VPTIAASVRAQAVSGVTRVAVQLNPAGSVQDAHVAASCGSASLDVAALSMAKAATYAPALRNCKAVAGAYTFSVKWAPW
jgi:TonB family protein